MIGRCGMKFKYCQKIRFFFVISCVLASATQAFAQDTDDILAYRSTGKAVAENNDLDAEIFAAMQALDEVGTIIDDRANSTKNSTAKSKNDAPTQIQNAPQVDIDSLLAAANAPEQTQIIDAKKAIPVPKHNIQTAGSLKVDDIATPPAPKHDIQTAGTKKVAAQSTTPAPKHDIQTAGAKKVAANSVALPPKHNVQMAANMGTTAQATKSKAPDGTRSTTAPQPKVAPTVNSMSSLALAYVSDVYRINGLNIEQKIGNDRPTIGDVYQYAFKQKLVYQTTRPAIGDLVFFHNTFDRNRDGRWNDWHSLVGIVENVDDDETITVLIYTTKIEKIALNLKYPELKSRKGNAINSQLRPDEGSQIGSAAKLFAGFANLLGDIPSVTVIDNWQPGMRVH